MVTQRASRRHTWSVVREGLVKEWPPKLREVVVDVRVTTGDAFADEGHPESEAEIGDDVAAGGFHTGLTGGVVPAVEGLDRLLDLVAFLRSEVNAWAIGEDVGVPAVVPRDAEAGAELHVDGVSDGDFDEGD